VTCKIDIIWNFTT